MRGEYLAILLFNFIMYFDLIVIWGVPYDGLPADVHSLGFVLNSYSSGSESGSFGFRVECSSNLMYLE